MAGGSAKARPIVRVLAVAMLAGVALGWQPARAAGLPAPGQVVAASLELLGKRIPLPPGDWKVASVGYGSVTGPEPGPYGAIGGVLLVPAAADPYHAFLLIHTNVLPVRGGWGQPGECTAADALFQSVAEVRDLHNGCSFVIARDAGRVVGPEVPALVGARQAAALLPPWALEAGFRVSDRRDFVDLRYGAAPAMPAPRGWFGPAAGLDEAHRLVVTRLADWAQQARATALAALRDPADQVQAMPAPPFASAGTAASPAGETISTMRLATYKLLTLRAVGSTIAFLTALVVTGDPYVAVSYVVFQGITHSAVYFANELAWEWPAATPVSEMVAVAAMPSADPPPSVVPQTAVFAVDGKQVPLPAGPWLPLARRQDDRTTTTILGRLEGRALAGLAAIYTNPMKTKNILGATSECARTDIYYSINRYDTPVDGFCSYAKPVLPDWGAGDGPWAEVAQQLTARGVDLPPVLMMVGARVRTQENFLDVRYYFPPDPASLALSLPDQGLAASRLASSAMLQERVAALQAWADLLQEPLEQGVRGRLAAADSVLPWPWQTEAVADGLIRQVHQPLRDLSAAGVLDSAGLRRQLALADAALLERERQRTSLWWRSAYKVATWRVAAVIDGLVVGVLVTGSAVQTVTMVAFFQAAAPIIGYANEIAWAAAGVGKPRAALVDVEFPEIGPDRL